MAATKPCAICDRPIPKDKRHTPRQYAALKHCSFACRTQARVNRVIAGDSRIHSEGYRRLYVPWHPSSSSGYVYEHRVVMERVLGRLLASHEYVHHRNDDQLDNRPENLEVLSSHAHRILHGNGVTNEHIAELILRGISHDEIVSLGPSGHRVVRVRRALRATGRSVGNVPRKRHSDALGRFQDVGSGRS